MIKKLVLTLSLLAILSFVMIGCSENTKASIENQEEEIAELEQLVEEANEMRVASEDSVALAEKEVDKINRENEALKLSLQESQDKLMALEELDAQPLALSPYPGMTVLQASIHVLDAMRTNDFATLATYVDPVDGVYLSPYQYIDFSYTMNMTSDNILNMATLPTVFPWGNAPGSGDLISLNLLDYYNTYVYDEDYYLAPVVGMNTLVSSGNMINNIATSFPTSDTVEFLYPEFNPSYDGLDWSSITLVFKTDSGMPMLLGIVHGDWTP